MGEEEEGLLGWGERMRRKEMKGEPRERSAVSLSREILWYSKIAGRNSLVLLETDRYSWP